jgi:hypothetical protein
MRKAKIFLPAIFLLALFVVADKTEAKAGNGIQLKNAVITTVDTENKIITAEKNGMTHTVDASSATFRRKYGAKCDIYELTMGDYIWVWGRMSEGNTIIAKKVKDYSIQKWRGLFIGTIIAIDSGSYTDDQGRNYQQFTIESRHRGEQTIRVYETTRIQYRKESKTFSDLAVGQEIIAKGTWNNTHSFVYDTKWIKIRKLAE